MPNAPTVARSRRTAPPPPARSEGRDQPAAGRPALPRSETLHQRIRGDIEARILSGEWRPGHRIPSEHALMAQYGCARMTVNKALLSLVEAGLIERRRRAGSFVRQPRAQSAVLTIPDIQAEIIARSLVYRFELLSTRRRRATAAERATLGVVAGATILHVRCRHFAGARVFALEDRRIVLDEVPQIADADLRIDPPGTWLLHHIPWHAAEHQISALNADADIAKLLQVPPGTACLVVDRQTWRANAAVTSVRLWFPGDLQRLVTRFTPTTRTTA